jgi:hypothetical protein
MVDSLWVTQALCKDWLVSAGGRKSCPIGLFENSPVAYVNTLVNLKNYARHMAVTGTPIAYSPPELKPPNPNFGVIVV